jgi:uncharacterized protein (DUF2267 family)
MSSTDLAVFDKTLQTTNIWLSELCDTIGPDRRAAWKVLGAVLRALRDRLPLELGAHLGAELPLLVRGAFYHQYQPHRLPLRFRDRGEFLDRVQQNLDDMHPLDVREAVVSVLHLLDVHLPAGQCEKLRGALPEEIRGLWRKSDASRLRGEGREDYRRGGRGYAGDERFRGDNERGFGARRHYEEEVYDSGNERSGRRSVGVEGDWNEGRYRASDERSYGGGFNGRRFNPSSSYAPRYEEDDRRLRTPYDDTNEDRRRGPGQPGWFEKPRAPALAPTWYGARNERRLNSRRGIP